MGWFWDTSSSISNTKSNSDGSKDDPLRNLDPSLREFLEKESPVKYTSSEAPATPPPEPQRSYSDQLNLSQQSPTPSSRQSPSPSTENPTEKVVPSESLYQDGRYAHLWKNYQPLAEIENSTKSDQDKLLDILEGYKERKAQIGRAALENCAIEQEEVNNCYKNGGFMSTMTMCRAENKQFQRCYLMQAVCASIAP